MNDLDEEVMDLYDTIGSNARGAIESSTHSASEKNYMRKQLQRLEEESGKR